MWISKNDGRYELEEKLKHSDGSIYEVVQLLRVGKTTWLNLEPVKEVKTINKVNGMFLFTTDLFSYHKEERTFVAESSELDLPAEDWNSLRHTPVEIYIELTNPKTNDSRQFKFTHADMNDGEAMGWNYKSKDGIRLLIIND